MNLPIRLLCIALVATPSLLAAPLVDSGNGSATQRNGTGVNPNIYVPISIPTIGETYQAEVQLNGNGWGLVYSFAFSAPSSGTIIPPFGEILVDPSSGGFFLDIGNSNEGQNTPLFFDIPNDSALVGLFFATQSLFKDSSGVGQLTNAIDIVIGC